MICGGPVTGSYRDQIRSNDIMVGVSNVTATVAAELGP